MKRLKMTATALLLLAGVSAAAQNQEAGSAAADASRKARLTEHVYYFASDSLCGRKAGSEDAAKARAYIVKQYEEIGLIPLFKNLEVPFQRNGGDYVNVVGLIPGNDEALKNEYIVLGAHYDHLGLNANGEVFNGADDNASGSAALIEVARELQNNRDQLKRSVIIAAFDAEEIGLFGSTQLAEDLDQTFGIENVKLMMSLDMVGWYRQSGKLHLEGVGTIMNGRELLMAEAARSGVNVKLKKFEDSVFTATDTEGFAIEAVPTLAVTTGLKSPYHKVGDDADLIDYDGLDKVSGFITDLTMTTSGDPDFKASGKVAEKHDSKTRVVDFGVVGGLGSSYIGYNGGAFLYTRTKFSYSAGLQCSINFRKSAIMTGVEYGVQNSCYPVDSDIYNSVATYSQRGIIVPAMLVGQVGARGMKSWFGAGAYYQHVLDYKVTGTPMQYTIPTEQWGLQWGLGFKLGHISFGLVDRFQIGNLFVEDNAPRAYLSHATIQLGFLF